MQKAMRLLALSALLAMPTAQPAQAGCYMDCYNTFYQQHCSGYPPGSVDEQVCASYYDEICRCHCTGYTYPYCQ